VIEAWIDSRTTRSREIDVGADGTVRADFP
jgi:hypothetical protein